MKFKEAMGSEASKDFLRLKDGESVKGVLRGEPYEFRQHWVGSRSEICKGGDNCSHCKIGAKASFRFRINFVVNEGGRYVVRVLEQGWNLYKALNNLNQDYDLERHVIKITRHGAGKNDTTYAVVPLPNGTVSEETMNEIGLLRLHDLTKLETQDASSNHQDSEEVPF